MGKKRLEDELPTLGSQVNSTDLISEEQPVSVLENIPIVELAVNIPSLQRAEGYATRYVETKLTPDEAIAFKAVLLALVRQHTRLKSGRFIKRPADVYRWIAEQIAEKYADHNRHGDRSANG